jgi:MoaA/NifB/PqqE/SkfB family radical SAM enzyme
MMFAKRKDVDEVFGAAGVESPRKLFVFHCDYACHAKCEHCLMGGLDLPKMRISNDVAEEIIRLCAELKIRLYPVSGDPFTWIDYLENFLLPKCDEHGCERVISTCGFWGNDDKMIVKALDMNLQNLVITVDRFHQKFVPVERINRIMDAFKDHKKTRLFIASVWSPDISPNEIKLKYDVDRYELPMLSFTKYWEREKDFATRRFFSAPFDGEIVDCRKHMHYVNDFGGNVYIECAAYLQGFPCKVGNVFEDSASTLERRRLGPRLKFKLNGYFDPTAPHTDACIDCQRAGLVDNFFVDKTFEVDRWGGKPECRVI